MPRDGHLNLIKCNSFFPLLWAIAIVSLPDTAEPLSSPCAVLSIAERACLLVLGWTKKAGLCIMHDVYLGH